MVRVTVDVPRERVAEVVEHLKKLKDVRVEVEPAEQTPEPVPPQARVQRDWGGILKDHDTSELEKHIDNVRDEWEDRF
jgi:hypothetical protein